MCDLEHYWPLLTEGGAILGDDALSMPEVIAAVVQFAHARNAYFMADLSKFAMTRPGGLSPRLRLLPGQEACDLWGGTASVYTELAQYSVPLCAGPLLCLSVKKMQPKCCHKGKRKGSAHADTR
jgi:hypothetical protein